MITSKNPRALDDGAELGNWTTSPPEEATEEVPIPSSSGFTWEPTRISSDSDAHSCADRLAEATPSNDELRTWAGRPENQPPQSWWEEKSDPFEAEDE